MILLRRLRCRGCVECSVEIGVWSFSLAKDHDYFVGETGSSFTKIMTTSSAKPGSWFTMLDRADAGLVAR